MLEKKSNGSVTRAVKIEAEKNSIYIDPWEAQKQPEGRSDPDSHSHGDHLSPADIKKNPERGYRYPRGKAIPCRNFPAMCVP